ncbi:IclR family transcriptional regulator [Curvivirga sp.]|uniref:IclR family transcriptional regulator n=1 Tax=Curvivirga sp. TaxID=2856848 RepID=UPI003B5ADDF5
MANTIQGTQSFGRSIQVLQEIADAEKPPLISDLLKTTELSRPTLYRILASLEQEGLIKRNNDKSYALGGRLISLARRALSDNNIRSIAQNALEELRDQTGETVHLAIRSGDELVYIDKFESRATVKMASKIGTRVPFHSSGVGKAFMAALSTEESEELLTRISLPAITPFTTTDKVQLRKTIEEVRKHRYVFDDQENEEGIVCFGAAILNDRNIPEASISVSIPKYRLKPEYHEYIGPLLQCVDKIGKLLT